MSAPSAIIISRQHREGGGFRVRRPIGDDMLRELDPFLLLDHLGPATYAPGEAVGAPDHPHRGFQTVSYIVEGSFQHIDSSGSRGVLRTDGVQWMTAGKGVVHAEMPSDDIIKNGGTIEGFQIWVNLPAKLKMIDPRYQDFEPQKIPNFKLLDGESYVRVIAGEYEGVSSPVETRIETMVFDARLTKNGRATFKIPQGMNGLVYCWRGSGHCELTRLEMGQAVVYQADLGKDIAFTLEADETGVMYSLVLCGKPIGEPIERWGPFVMNTKAELEQARLDYQEGRLGARISGSDERMRQTKTALAMQQKNNNVQ